MLGYNSMQGHQEQHISNYSDELYQYTLDNKTGDYCLEEVAVWDGVSFKVKR